MVSLDGTIDFYCFPHFYSPSVFAALLAQDRGGFFRFEPQLKNRRFKQLYLPDTNILLTRYLSEDAVVELIDFMPVDQDGGSQFAYAHQIIRKVKAVKGPVRLKLRCAPRFDYARRARRLQATECSLFPPRRRRSTLHDTSRPQCRLLLMVLTRWQSSRFRRAKQPPLLLAQFARINWIPPSF